MPTNDQDARALTYLARRLRTETHGARAWDEAGTYATISKYVGQNLAETVERITRHAADPEARTPGAIARPFVPEPQPSSRRDDVPTHLRCSVCNKQRVDCVRIWSQAQFRDADGKPDHEFDPIRDDRKRPPDAMAAIVGDLRGRTTETTPTEEIA